jgi:hypothetical protein
MGRKHVLNLILSHSIFLFQFFGKGETAEQWWSKSWFRACLGFSLDFPHGCSPSLLLLKLLVLQFAHPGKVGSSHLHM